MGKKESLRKFKGYFLAIVMIMVIGIIPYMGKVTYADDAVVCVITQGTSVNYSSISEAAGAAKDGSKIKLLADVTIGKDETVSFGEEVSYAVLDLNGHKFTVNGTLKGEYVSEYPEYSPSVTVESGTVGTFVCNGACHLALCPWTADTYVFSDGAIVDKYLGVDGGTVTFKGGICNGGMLINNGGEGDINFTIAGNACFSNMGSSRFVVYAPQYSETSIHLTLQGGYYDEDPRLFYMHANEDTGELEYDYIQISRFIEGYKYYQYSDGVFSEIADEDITDENLEAWYMEEGSIYLCVKDFVTIDENDIEQYSGQTNWKVDGKEYPYRIVDKTAEPVNISNATVKVNNSNYVYDGNKKEPDVTVVCDNVQLTKGQDYSVKYSNNINAGTATVTVTGIGDYTGTKNCSFTINKLSLKTAKISLKASVYTYDGKAKTPVVTVKIGNKTLNSKSDYNVKYSNNVKAGSATVTVTGKGNYTGTAATKFTINAMPISKASLSVKNVTYNGKALKPAVIVKVNGKTLKCNTDYTVAYSNNKNCGKASFVITGKGNYAGKKNGSFVIMPAKVSLKNVKSTVKSKMSVTWNKASGGINGYQISVALNNTFKNGKKDFNASAGAVTKLITGLNSGKYYYVRVRAFKNVGKTKYFGAWSVVKKIKCK